MNNKLKNTGIALGGLAVGAVIALSGSVDATEVVKVTNDPKIAIEQLPVEITDTKPTVTFKGNLSIINIELDSINLQIDSLQKRKQELQALKAKIKLQTDKIQR